MVLWDASTYTSSRRPMAAARAVPGVRHSCEASETMPRNPRAHTRVIGRVEISEPMVARRSKPGR